jgi:branched-chain amino acid transport system ATP-binding protein
VTVPAAPAPDPAPLLELRGVSAAYGPYEALFDVSLQVRSGRALALVGANGAGKSTVARVVSGLVPTTRGSIRFDGRDVTGRPAYEIARLGLSQLTEGRSVFASLSVEENLVLAFRRALGRRGVPDALARAYEAFPQLGERRGQSAGTLSGGEQRMLALARVLVLHQKLLVVDELSFGLAPVVVDDVYEALGQVLAAGTSLLLIEQHVDRALVLADDVVVLSKGRVVFTGEAAGSEGAVAELVLGRPGTRPDPVVRPGPEPLR